MFLPDYRNVKRQKHCQKPTCRKAAKAESQKEWLKKPKTLIILKDPSMSSGSGSGAKIIRATGTGCYLYKMRYMISDSYNSHPTTIKIPEIIILEFGSTRLKPRRIFDTPTDTPCMDFGQFSCFLGYHSNLYL